MFRNASYGISSKCLFLWSVTYKEVVDAILNASIQRLFDTNALMFIRDKENLTPNQRVILVAIEHGFGQVYFRQYIGIEIALGIQRQESTDRLNFH